VDAAASAENKLKWGWIALVECQLLAHPCRLVTSALTVSFGGRPDSLCSLRVL